MPAAPKKPAKAPAAKKPAASAAKAPAKAPARKASKPATTEAPPVRKAHARADVGAEQRRNYIEVAAYFIAERHGFMPGRELQDWAAAEAEIDRLLAEGRLNA